MGIFTTTFSQMLVLFSLILIGFLLTKLKAIPEDSNVVLSKMENNLFVPALVLGTFINNFTYEKLKTAWQTFLISFCICIVMMILAVLISRMCSKDHYVRNIFSYGLAFSNFGFVGNAVVNVVFPDLFVDYLMFTMPFWVMIYMWGVPYLLIPKDEGKQTIAKRLKSFANPMFIGMIIGMVIGLTGLNLPGFVTTVISVAGDCMSPVAMLLTGVVVAKMNLKKVLSIKSIYVVTFVRLILFPLMFVGIFLLVPAPETIIVCTVCALAMPSGLTSIVVPEAYGKDTSVAAGTVLVSHVLACVTIPLIFYLMTHLLHI